MSEQAVTQQTGAPLSAPLSPHVAVLQYGVAGATAGYAGLPHTPHRFGAHPASWGICPRCLTGHRAITYSGVRVLLCPALPTGQVQLQP